MFPLLAACWSSLRQRVDRAIRRREPARTSALLPPTTERRRSTKRGTLRAMHAPKIRVENGRIQIDEPTDLPNGTELYLVPAAPLDGAQVDDLDDEERAELHHAIREGFEDAKAGRTIPAEQWIAELRSRL